MASPFPGMDPYLENPARWPDVHQGLISAMRASLNALLPPGYVASMGERCQVVPIGRSIYPDVLLRQRPAAITAGQPPSSGHVTAVATDLAAPDPPLILEELSLEPVEPYIEIKSLVDQSRVVTAIEVLSPANKEASSEGRNRYKQKQQEILSSHTHLIEIDLLRAGLHTVAAPRPAAPYHYLISLHRGGEGRRYMVWPNTFRERLPRIVIPLDAGIPDVIFDLQSVFDRNYEEGAYALQIDYASDALPPLAAEESEWADALLRAQHLR
jgi:hypothetical protein